MKTLGFTFVAAAVGLALAGPAQAKSLRTAPASASFSSAVLVCQVTNIGTDAVVQMEARSYGGNLVGQSLVYDLSHPKTGSWYAPNGAAYCKFEILKGSSKRLRAHALYVDLVSGNHLMTTPAR